MRDSVVFYRNFRDAISKLPKKDRLAAYEALFDYALDEKEPGNGPGAAIVQCIIPVIDKNNRRYENGKKGGRPESETESGESKNQTTANRKPKDNRTETKAKPNDNQNTTNTEPKCKSVKGESVKGECVKGESSSVSPIGDNTLLVTASGDRALDPAPTPKQLDAEFAELWDLYPRKQGKKDALRHYISARKNGATFGEVRAGLEAYARYVQANRIEPQFIKQGSAWFCEHCWEDDYSIRLRAPTTADVVVDYGEISEMLGEAT